MIRVTMSEEDGVQIAYAGVEELLSHVGGRIDQHARRTFRRDSFNQERTAAAAVSRVLRIASAPKPAQARNASR
jgi:hypothetical protein